MHSDLIVRAAAARASFVVPEFPLEAIQARQPRVQQTSRRRWAFGSIVGISLIAAAAAATQVAYHAKLEFMPKGGIVIAADAYKTHTIHSVAEIAEAAKALDFKVTLPAGLPDNATPIKIDVAGSSIAAITYSLPNNRHLWIMLANPAALRGRFAPAAAPANVSRRGMRSDAWTVAGESVVVASNELGTEQFTAIKSAMQREAAAQ